MLVSIVFIAFQWMPAGNNPTIFLFFSKIEDIHFSCIDFHVGGGGIFFQK